MLDRVKGVAESAFLEQNWHYVRDLYPLSKEDFLRLLSHHYTKLTIAGGLMLLVQLLVLTATCVLRGAMVNVRYVQATADERSGLMGSSDDDSEEDDEQVV